MLCLSIRKRPSAVASGFFFAAAALWASACPLCLAKDGTEAYPFRPGPHLLIDDFLIAESQGVKRRVNQPRRFLAEPVVTSRLEHQNWQPWLTVLHDPARPAGSRFRMWYDADVLDDVAEGAFATKLGYLESADGLAWPGPYQRPEKVAGILFGASVLDDGPEHPVAAERYKLLYYSNGGGGMRAGPYVAFSPDGLSWTMHDEPILSPHGDSWHAGYDPIRKRYFLIGKLYYDYTWTNAEGKTITAPIRRYGVSFSEDFRRWSELKVVFSPDEKDPGITQWYAAVGFMTRGDLLFGFLQVLRDDLTAEGAPQEAIDCNLGNPGAGTGHTVLCWTRDGETWHRDRQQDAFLEPDPRVGAWDHAMAWVSSAVPVGDEIYLYYAGYRWGHKYQKSLDRQVGLVKMQRDRYVAREAGEQRGTLKTRRLRLEADSLLLNADAAGGEIRVQVLGANGQVIPGFSYADCQPITVDSLAGPVAWKEKLGKLRGQEVQLEFAIHRARLFALKAK